jgi:hypothetical protein
MEFIIRFKQCLTVKDSLSLNKHKQRLVYAPCTRNALAVPLLAVMRQWLCEA